MKSNGSVPKNLEDNFKRIKARLKEVESGQVEQISRHLNLISSSFDTKKRGSIEELFDGVKFELNLMDRELEEVEVLVDEVEDEFSRSKSLERLEELKRITNSLRLRVRTLSLDFKRKLDSSVSKATRAELFQKDRNESDSKTRDRSTMSGSNDIAQSLRNTLEIMKQELDRSVLSTQMLEQQTKTLQMASDQYTSFEDLMKTSKALLNSLKRADLIDRLLIVFGFGFFSLVVTEGLVKSNGELEKIIATVTSIATASLIPKVSSKKQHHKNNEDSVPQYIKKNDVISSSKVEEAINLKTVEEQNLTDTLVKFEKKIGEKVEVEQNLDLSKRGGDAKKSSSVSNEKETKEDNDKALMDKGGGNELEDVEFQLVHQDL
ncbi:Sec20-domain-containing protein [Phakopsora pachyrhizi]|nr:Sec20-domain-containing protein [Phakopsora pachyrhizi]